MNRRDILKTGVAAIALSGLPSLATIARADTTASPTGTPEDARLATLLDHIMTEMLDRSPETVTSIGLDSGARAGAKAKLDDRSIASWEEDKRRTRRQRADLMAIDRGKLTGLGPSNYDSVLFQIAVEDDINGLPYIGSPYAVSQLTGAYQQVPDFLDSQHSIATSADAEAYLSRLAAFATGDYVTFLTRGASTSQMTAPSCSFPSCHAMTVGCSWKALPMARMYSRRALRYNG